MCPNTIDSEHNGYGTELSDIIKTFDEQAAFDSQMLKNRFWNIFIVDAFIGNWDRHNGNWGFLYNPNTDAVALAPVYDCGSCLFPQADDSIMKNTLENKSELDLRVFDIPLSGIKLDGQKIRYFDFISSLQNCDCNSALKRIFPKIDMGRINSIIDNTPFVTDLQKLFYKTILKERKERILGFSYRKLLEAENCD